VSSGWRGGTTTATGISPTGVNVKPGMSRRLSSTCRVSRLTAAISPRALWVTSAWSARPSSKISFWQCSSWIGSSFSTHTKSTRLG
jgi:hypothetical protein